jgi:predicted PhzF superfamily epimerase YddE/YHI9
MSWPGVTRRRARRTTHAGTGPGPVGAAASAPTPRQADGGVRRYGLLGCFVYVPPAGDRPGAARMFAPAIGVDEDVANANSTGCLAAHLLATTGAQTVAIEVERQPVGEPWGPRRRPHVVADRPTTGMRMSRVRSVGGRAVMAWYGRTP